MAAELRRACEAMCGQQLKASKNLQIISFLAKKAHAELRWGNDKASYRNTYAVSNILSTFLSN
jgi:hypothetical protein